MSKEKKVTNSLSLEELNVKSGELLSHLFKLRMQKATGQLADTSLIRLARKELARVKTFQTLKANKAAPQPVKGK